MRAAAIALAFAVVLGAGPAGADSGFSHTEVESAMEEMRRNSELLVTLEKIRDDSLPIRYKRLDDLIKTVQIAGLQAIARPSHKQYNQELVSDTALLGAVILAGAALFGHEVISPQKLFGGPGDGPLVYIDMPAPTAPHMSIAEFCAERVRGQDGC